MGYILVIAEKPDQARKLAAPYKSKNQNGYIEVFPCETFPGGAYFSWCMGHLIEIQDPSSLDPERWGGPWILESLPIIPNQFKYTVSKSGDKKFQALKLRQFTLLKSLIHKKEVDFLINGCDAGREGSHIFGLVVKMAGSNKPIKRLWTSSLTPNAVKQAFKNLLPESKDKPLFYEAQARAIGDWLVGLSTTRAYTLLLNDGEPASKGDSNSSKRGEVYATGRVQSPVLSLIVQREIEIENFKPTPYWEVFADFDISGQKYQGKWFKKDVDRIDDEQKAKSLADYCRGKSASIKDVLTERKNFEPPLLFNLSALQTTANKRFKMSPEITLDIAQSLYMASYISYPRSDSQYVTEEEAKNFPEIIEELSKIHPYREMIPTPISSLLGNKRFVSPEDVSDHYAIIPTENIPNLRDLTDDEQKIYDLIVKSLIAAHYERAIFEYSSVTTVVDGKFTFSTKGKTMIQEGWRKIIFPNNEGDDVENDDTLIPSVAKGEVGLTINTDTKEKMTKAPNRYSQGDLIPLMKSGGERLEDVELEKVLKQTNGLGTESTRASIIKKLKDLKYIEVNKNLVYPTKKGKLLIKAIGDSILTSAKLTAQWEQRLNLIGKGQADQAKFIEQAKTLTRKLVEDAIDRLKDQKVIFENVQSAETESKTEGEPKPVFHKEETATEGSTSPSTPNIPTERPSKRKTTSNVPLGQCKLCGADVVDKGNFYGCSAYRENGCGFTLGKRILGQDISRENIELLLSTGDTRLIEGFTHRNGNGTFKAVLSWDEELKKLVFKSPNPNSFKLPMNLLKPLTIYDPPEEDTAQDFRALEREASALKYPAKVVGVTHGPRITRYEMLPNKGINITGYKRFKANFQAALKAKRVSMYIPIPGTNLIGVEIPNKNPYPVQLRGLLENEEFQAKKKSLSFPLGMDLRGNAFFADLAEMPHLLVAGATGSGKSVFLNTLILSLLYGNTPDELKFMFIDPKQVELSVYEALPHLFAPIVTNVNHAGKALDSLVREMEQRYEMLQSEGVRNITGYNAKMERLGRPQDKLPYICLIIDEVADLMMTATDLNVETYITRLAGVARAAGINMVIATQRPTKKVLSPLIKANMPVRVGFAVASSADSMTILDSPGAEDLLGKGDMIYLPKDRPRIRLQSGFVSDEEIEKVVRYLKETYSKKTS